MRIIQAPTARMVCSAKLTACCDSLSVPSSSSVINIGICYSKTCAELHLGVLPLRVNGGAANDNDRIGPGVSRVSNYPSDEDLSPGTPVSTPGAPGTDVGDKMG